MKRKIIFGILLGVFIFSFLIFSSSVSAACTLDSSLISQDPYPAIPGEETKIVFQITGIGNPDCGTVEVELIEKFPFSLIPGQEKTVTAKSGQVSDFSSYLIAPFKLKVHPEALDGENSLEIRYGSSQGVKAAASVFKKFNVSVRDVRTDFEISIKDYEKATNTLTFEILNVGEHDVEALTVDMPTQDNIAVKGARRNIVGSLDSNEDTTFSFEAIPKDGEINLVVLYTDEINERRQLEKTVEYDSIYFTGRAGDSSGVGMGTYIILVIIIVIVVWYFWRRNKKKKEAHRKKNLHS